MEYYSLVQKQFKHPISKNRLRIKVKSQQYENSLDSPNLN